MMFCAVCEIACEVHIRRNDRFRSTAMKPCADCTSTSVTTAGPVIAKRKGRIQFRAPSAVGVRSRHRVRGDEDESSAPVALRCASCSGVGRGPCCTIAFIRRVSTLRGIMMRCPHPRQTRPISAPSRTTFQSVLPQGCGLRRRTMSSIAMSSGTEHSHRNARNPPMLLTSSTKYSTCHMYVHGGGSPVCGQCPSQLRETVKDKTTL
jgi:hypothetical protein